MMPPPSRATVPGPARGAVSSGAGGREAVHREASSLEGAAPRFDRSPRLARWTGPEGVSVHTFLSEGVEAYLAFCFQHRTPPRLKEFTRAVGLTRLTLTRACWATHDLPPAAYLKRRQVEHSVQLLAQTDLSLTRVAYAAGFGTRRAFYRVFRAIVGMTPGEYRKGRHLGG